jgi:hypothetical protein
MNACKTCKWFRAAFHTAPHGKCMLHPPIVGTTTGSWTEDGTPIVALGEYRPTVEWDDYCKAHELDG